MPDRPTTTVTTFDHHRLDQLVAALEDVVDNYSVGPDRDDADVRSLIQFGRGAVAALHWISGGSANTRLYVLLEEAEAILVRKKGATRG